MFFCSSTQMLFADFGSLFIESWPHFRPRTYEKYSNIWNCLRVNIPHFELAQRKTRGTRQEFEGVRKSEAKFIFLHTYVAYVIYIYSPWWLRTLRMVLLLLLWLSILWLFFRIIKSEASNFWSRAPNALSLQQSNDYYCICLISKW